MFGTRGGIEMSDLTHIFKVNQKVYCNFDGTFHKGIVKETYVDHIIVDVPEISDHCWFENGFNIGDVCPEYNFKWKADFMGKDVFEMEVMYETEKVKVIYEQWDLGLKYKAFSKADIYGTRVSFGTLSEATNYAKKLENGGR